MSFCEKANAELRREMRANDVPFWRLAELWGCNETTAIKRFRVELPAEERERVRGLIAQAAQREKTR